MDPMSKVGLDVLAKTGVEPAGARGSAKALVKGLALVEQVAAADASVRLHELVDHSGLPRPTVLRLLDTLCSAGVLAALDGAYSLGPVLAVWGQRYLERLSIPLLARPVMEQLVAETCETCFVGVRDQSHVLYVAKVAGGQAVQLAASTGSRMPLYSTGIGKALLAFCDEATVAEMLAQPLLARTANTLTDPTLLREEFARIRERGYSTDDAENENGVRCVATPVRGPRGDVVAALSVSAPAYRFEMADLHRLAPRVQAAAAEISALMGSAAHPKNTAGGRRGRGKSDA